MSIAPSNSPKIGADAPNGMSTAPHAPPYLGLLWQSKRLRLRSTGASERGTSAQWPSRIPAPKRMAADSHEAWTFVSRTLTDEESIGFPRPFCVMPNPVRSRLPGADRYCVGAAGAVAAGAAGDRCGACAVADGGWCAALNVVASRVSRWQRVRRGAGAASCASASNGSSTPDSVKPSAAPKPSRENIFRREMSSLIIHLPVSRHPGPVRASRTISYEHRLNIPEGEPPHLRTARRLKNHRHPSIRVARSRDFRAARRGRRAGGHAPQPYPMSSGRSILQLIFTV